MQRRLAPSKPLALLLLLPLAACSASGPKDAQVRAQRPFISSETETVGDQVIAVEAGGAVVSGREAEIPIALRYGLGPRSEVFAQTSPYRMVDRNENAPDGSGWGDSYVGVRHRLRDADMYSPAYGFQISTKLPSGRPSSGLGSGEIDWFGALMAQQTYYGFETTGFYQLGLLGEQFEPDTNIEHTLALQTRKPMGGPITAFGEVAFIAEPEIDRTESTLMGGMSIQLDHLTAVDLAIRVGLGDDAEDFQVLFGISRARRATWALALALAACAAPSPDASGPELPLFVLTVEDTRLSRSCRVRIPPGVVLHDSEGDGVLHVVADGVTLEFEPGSHLLGSHDAPWDELSGVGVRVDGARDVTLRGLHASGFKTGVLATRADGLVIEDCDLSDNFRQRLRSTPQAADDASDWLRPHANDGQEWRRLYGAGICVEDSRGVTVRRCRARRVQNGLILDRVSGSEVHDNDFSYLSGWGLALWRACDNVIAHNALDYCVRGYSEGVYNRGQDSAGVLLFEQSSRNLFAGNSITFGGDGVFGFAGSEALGEAVPPVDFSYERAGSNDNVFVGNDLSGAVAHGLELTFSFGTVIARNRFDGNLICGVWAGYCRDSWIFENEFSGNGFAGYGLEAGGINIEHGERNRILDNRFEHDRVGVHLWWDPDEGLTKLPWAEANGVASDETLLARNAFRLEEAERTGVLLRDAGFVGLHRNVFDGPGTAVDARGETQLQQLDTVAVGAMSPLVPDLESLPGEARPVGATRGPGRIVMTEWGPWDGEEPLLLPLSRSGPRHHYELFGVGTPKQSGYEFGSAYLVAPQPWHVLNEAADESGTRRLFTVSSRRRGITPYTIAVGAPPGIRIDGTLVDLDWSVRVFPWTVDPREDLAGWRAEAEGVAPVVTDAVDLRLRAASPADVDPPLAPPGFQTDRFGVLAATEFVPNVRRMTVRTVSDDGVRVWWNDELVIENWTVHGPTVDERTLEIADPTAPVTLRVEHFELDGDATLVVELDAR